MAAPAGNVDFAIGGVTVTGTDGRARPAARGQELQSGDRIVTTDGRAQIRFTDGAFVSLQPNTDFAIRDYRYEGKTDGSERGVFGLVRGALRTVTGAIGRVNRNAYQIQTPTATIGIRGTGGLVQVQDDGTTRIVGWSGVWTLANKGGTIDVPARQAAVATPRTDEAPTETTVGPLVPAPPPGPLEVALLRRPQDDALPPFAGTNTFVSADAVNPAGVPLPLAEGSPPIPAPPSAVTPPPTPPVPPVPPPTVLTNGTYDAYQQVGITAFPPNTTQAYPGASVTFGPSGEAVTIGPTALNTGTVYEINNMYPVAWGRWTGSNVNAPPVTGAVSQDQGVPYVVGIPTPAALMPVTGVVSFIPVGATNPTRDDGAGIPGSFQAGQMAVNFATARIGLQFNLVFSNFTYTVSTAGGVANPNSSALSITAGTSTFAGTNVLQVNATPITGPPLACSVGCQMNVKGGFFGASGADYAGFVYGSAASGVSGAAVFKK